MTVGTKQRAVYNSCPLLLRGYCGQSRRCLESLCGILFRVWSLTLRPDHPFVVSLELKHIRLFFCRVHTHATTISVVCLRLTLETSNSGPLTCIIH
jgi:hypothetical protein